MGNFLFNKIKMHSTTPIIVFMCMSLHQFSGVLMHPQVSAFQPNETWNELRDAIETGNVDEFQRLLVNGRISINSTDNNGNSALLLAAEKGQDGIVQMLLEHGVHIDAVNKFNNSALILAVWAGFDKVAELLIKGGADVNISGQHKNTALMHAAEKGRRNIVKLLLENGANIDAVNQYNNSALILAVWAEFDSVAELLIQKGANVNVQGENGYTALMWAAQKGRQNIVELLVEQRRIDKSVRNINNDTAMILALKGGYYKAAETIIQRGALVNVPGQNGMWPLMWAAKKGFESTVRLLLDMSAYPDVVDDNNFSALLYAADSGHDGIVRLLYEKVKDSGVNADGDPTLVFATEKGLERAVEVLIKNGVNVNAANKYGTTALMVAAKNGNERIIKTILQNNATNINAIDGNGHTALDAVVTSSERHEKLRNLLMEYGAEYRGVELYRETSQKACRLYSNLTARWRYGTETRVFDGSLAEAGEFPWMVALGYLNKRYKVSFQCGGSIISDRFVLTAAHCVKDIQRPVVARFGKISLSDEDDFRAENQNIQEIIPHPKYSIVSKKNDIALIRLIERLLFAELIQPICLETDIEDVDTSVDVIVSGWGTTNSGKTSNDLLKITLKTMPLAACNTDLLEYNKKRNLASFRNGIDESQYCAHDPIGRQDSCQGDSGGPLQTIQSYSKPAKVVGVVSFGIGCGRGRPGIYTRVAHYIEWIGSHAWPNGSIESPQININSI